MGYLLAEIVVYLLIAGVIGFVFGWFVRDGRFDTYFEKAKTYFKKFTAYLAGFSVLKKAKEMWSAYYLTLTTTKKVSSKEVLEAKEEHIKEEVKTVKTKSPEAHKSKEEVLVLDEESVEQEDLNVLEVENDEESKPTLLTKAPSTGADKLSTIKGIGPVLEGKLNELGIYSFEQIASWDAEQELWIGTQMAFPKRVTKEEWVKQAKELVAKKA